MQCERASIVQGPYLVPLCWVQTRAEEPAEGIELVGSMQNSAFSQVYCLASLDESSLEPHTQAQQEKHRLSSQDFLSVRPIDSHSHPTALRCLTRV